MNNIPDYTRQQTTIQVLKTTLPEEQWRRVFLALRQDPLIWRALQDEALLTRAVQRLGDQARRWSPGEMAMLAAGAEFSAQDLREDLAFRPSLSTAEPVDASPEASMSEVATLSTIAARALQLRNQALEAGHWEGVVDPSETFQAQYRHTLLACLLDLSREPSGLLKVLIDASNRTDKHDLGLHALLALPLPAADLVSLLEAVLLQLPQAIQISILQKLQQFRSELAETAAENLILGWAVENQNEKLLPIDEIRQAFLRAELERLARHRRPAVGKLHQARESARGLQAHLAATLASVVSKFEPAEADWLTPLESWQEAVELSDDSQRDRFTARLAVAHLDRGQVDQAAALLPESASRYEVLIAQCLVEAERNGEDREQIRKLARAALIVVRRQIPSGLDEVSLELILRLGGLLMQVNLPSEAAEVAEIACRHHPHDLDLLMHLGKTYAACGRPEEAATTFSLAVGLDPEQLELRKQLAAALEGAADWAGALQERTVLLERIPSPDSEDLRDLAHCALMTGKFSMAIEVCHQALEIAPNDGLTYALLGEAYFENGEPERAAAALQTSTQLTPDQAQPWLSLARVQRKMGEADRALETLRSATHGAPQEPRIYAALGQAYETEGSPTQAATALEKAAQLAPHDAEVLFAYGRVLMTLGKIEEARPVLEEAYTINPTRPDLAHIFARAELELGEPRAAIQALAPLVRTQTGDAAVALDYAQALLNLGEDLDEAVETLELILQSTPNHLVAQALLAEAHCRSGQFKKALHQYRTLLESSLASDPEWRLQIMYGVGQASLGAGEVEAAIAAFQEALQIDEPRIEGYRHLAEAYHAAGLRANALEAAREALRMDPEGLDTLTWFARISVLMAANTGAVTALERAIELAPERTDLLALLGQTQISSGDEQSARESFERLMGFELASAADLAAAAEGFLKLGMAAQAAQCLERAVNSAERPDSKLLVRLSEARANLGDAAGALAALDQAMQHDSDLPPLYSRKANLLLGLGRTQAALACVQAALSLAPEDAAYLRQAALIHRSSGDYTGALSQAEQWVRLCPDDLSARHLAATLARSLLMPDYARRLLRDGWRSSMPAEAGDSELEPRAALAYFCLFADLSLDADEEIAAAEALTEAIKLDETDPSALALQARIDFRNGDTAGASQRLHALCKSWRANLEDELAGHEDISAPITCALAAEEARLWQASLAVLDVLESRPDASPLTAVATARALVRRAERQRLCEELGVRTHAPGPRALGDEAVRDFQEAIRKTQVRLPARAADANQEIRRWEARGAAVFQPDQQAARELQRRQAEPEDSAALIAVYRRLGDAKKGVEAAATFPLHPLTQLHLALTLRDENPGRAMAAATSACERERQDPVFQAALSRTALRNGQLQTAYLAIMAALEIWPDEAAWQEQAADILLRGEGLVEDEPQASLAHLEIAARLEPEHHRYPLRIGQILFNLGRTRAAIENLEAARDLNPKDETVWLDLARAYQADGRFEEAESAAGRLLDLNTSSREAHLIRAQTALARGDAMEAMRRSRSAVEAAPSHPPGYLLLADALEQLGQPKEAREVIQQGIDRCAAPLSLLLRQLKLIELLDGEDDALQAIDQLISRYPDEPRVHLAAVRILVETQRMEEASSAARQALRLADGQLESRDRAFLHHTLGRLLRRGGQLDQAVHHLSEAVRLDEANLEAYLDLGRAYLDRRAYDQALLVFQSALRVAPKDPRPYYQAGLTLKEGKDYVKAEEMLRRAAEIAPNDVAIHRQLGAVVALNIVHSHYHQASVKA